MVKGNLYYQTTTDVTDRGGMHRPIEGEKEVLT